MKQIRSFQLALLLFSLCVLHSFAQNSKPLTIGVTETFPSKILGENRTINIYLPEDYLETDTIHYPVIYIPDGGIEEDFIHITGIVRFNTQPWINRFPRSIVVGIENTNRKRDFTFAVSNLDFLEKVGFKKENMPSYGGSENYISFLEKELQPYIQTKYRTNANRTIIGESLAGLLCAEILLKRPELFDTYLIISPSLWWGDESLLLQAENLLQTNLKKPVKVSVSAPNKNEDKRMYREAKELYHVLKRNPKITSYYDYFPEELHSTVMHDAVYHALKLMYPKTGWQ